jgi:beta-aspartyl-peptidase (threonine type)
LLTGSFGCVSTSEETQERPVAADGPAWALAIHGGAGGLPRDVGDDVRDGYLRSLETVLNLGQQRLEAGASSLDVVAELIVLMEDDPAFNAGKGAVFNAEGEHELDASIMNGADLSAGGVAGVRTVKNPILLAREVMAQTRHLLLAAGGAEAFADEVGVERVEPSYFDVPARRKSLERALANEHKGTVGVVALDRNGHLAAGTSTGGLTAKKYGRVGDSPIIGAGTYADDEGCAVSGTGVGEEYIRHSAAYSVSSLVSDHGWEVQKAVDHLIHDVLKPGDGGVIAVDLHGHIGVAYNTSAMFRGTADSSGRFEVAIWE